MQTRLIVGLALAGGIVAVLITDGWMSAHAPADWTIGGVDWGYWLFNGALSSAIFLALTAATTHELCSLARGRGYKPFEKTAQAFVALLVIAPYVNFNVARQVGALDDSWGLLWMALAVGFTFIVQAVLHRTESAMENLSTTLFVIFYVGGLAGFMTKLRMEIGGPEGLAAMTMSIFIIKMTDAGAYFTGRAIGRRKMIAWLSPKKTWEGFAGGIATAVASAVAAGELLAARGLLPLEATAPARVGVWVVLGVVLGGFSVVGDLCASLLKRDARVQDSGQAFPGLGGVLDVLDSPLMAAPIAWLLWTRVIPLVA